jgi:hypothetical protein
MSEQFTEAKPQRSHNDHRAKSFKINAQAVLRRCKDYRSSMNVGVHYGSIDRAMHWAVRMIASQTALVQIPGTRRSRLPKLWHAPS